MRYFSYENNNKQVGVYNQRNKQFIPTAKLKTQASKKYFYGKDGELEEWLSTIESIVSPILLKIISNQELPTLMTTTHCDLLFFIILLDLRNPVRLNHWIKGRELFKERLISKNPDNINSSIIKTIDEMNNQDYNTIGLLISNTKGIVHYCMDLEIKVLKNMTETPFISSDYPLIKYNQFLEKRKWNYAGHNGYGTVGLQLFMPINDKYMLIIYDSNIYKVGDKKEKFVEITDIDTINQFNLLQCLNCFENLFFNQKVSNFYIEKLNEKAMKFKKANEALLKFYEVKDKDGNLNPYEEILTIESTDLKVNLNLQKIKFSSKAAGIKLDNCAVQFRSKAEEIYRYEKN